MKLSQIVEAKNKKAREAEEAEKLDEAIKLYEQNINEDIADQFAYDRLLVIYRKQKAYNQELRVIKRGIQVFREQLKEQLENNIGKKKNRSELIKLSTAFMKGAGLIDKKGNETHIPEPVNKWMKRQEVVEKRLKKK